jgi:hypothetical protein
MSTRIGFRPTLDGVIDAMSEKGYRIFNTPSQPFNLNIVGIRARTRVPKRFDDWLTVFYNSYGRWIFDVFPATTDPGLYYLGDEEMGSEEGTAILKEGQYRTAYKLGQHRDTYRALVQAEPVTVIRDFDRDEELDYDSGREETGHFGINIHRARPAGERSTRVANWSAGCQVVSAPHHFNSLIDLCEKARERFGNGFTYTLLHQRDLE